MVIEIPDQLVETVTGYVPVVGLSAAAAVAYLLAGIVGLRLSSKVLTELAPPVDAFDMGERVVFGMALLFWPSVALVASVVSGCSLPIKPLIRLYNWTGPKEKPS